VPSPDDAVAAASETVVSFFTVVRRLAHADARHGQHPKSWPILGRLSVVGTMRVNDLAEHVGLDASTVSRHVRALEDDGLVARDIDPDDRRAASVRITERGLEFMHEAIAIRGQILANATADWSSADRDQLATLMSRLAQSLDPSSSTYRNPMGSSN
jgi:DNA-binding MarR family transcriptional regulator